MAPIHELHAAEGEAAAECENHRETRHEYIRRFCCGVRYNRMPYIGVRGRSGVVYVLMEVGAFVGTDAGRIKCVFPHFSRERQYLPASDHITQPAHL